MTIAVMQPYIFPYIGYFQMINAVDTFVFYDDVNFIKRGWINRNRILTNGKDHLFTVPLKKVSQNNLIKDSYLNEELYKDWVSKFLITVESSYKKAPFFSQVFPLLKNIFEKEYSTINELAISSIKEIAQFLQLKTQFKQSSLSYDNKDMEREERLIDICHKENATHYINAIGGQELYTKDAFAEKGVKLSFIKSNPIEYPQFKGEFVPWLSIIDVLMFNERAQILEMLNDYELV